MSAANEQSDCNGLRRRSEAVQEQQVNVYCPERRCFLHVFPLNQRPRLQPACNLFFVLNLPIT